MNSLLVLVDFLEVLVGVNLQLAAGSLVASNDAIGMQLQSRDGPGMVNTALHAVTERSCLVVTADQQKNLLGIADSANTNGQSGLGNLVGVIVEETGVDDQSILGQSTDAGTGDQGGEGLIESNVAVNAGAAQEQVDTAVGSDLILVTLALGFQILGHAIENVHIFGRSMWLKKFSCMKYQ